MNQANPHITYYPACNDADIIAAQIARAAWYLAPLHPSQVRFSSELELERWIPDGYTPQLQAEFEHGLPNWLTISRQPITANELLQADIVVCWKGLEALHELHPKLEERLRKNGVAVFDVDHSNRVEGSRYIDISHRYLANDAQIIDRSHTQLADLASRFDERKRAFLFCSGPEVQRYPRYKFDDAINIVCNSVINDSELMDSVKPDIQIFGDPIFHFGCSMYAAEFRNRLAVTQQKFGFVNIIPIKYYNLFIHWQPQLAASTIAIPFDLNMDINLDLSRNFRIHTTDNILTLMMLPVGASLADHIYVLGCDGRPLEQNNYFWKHNEKAQFGSQMDNIQKVHPTFFTVDYDDYYLRHCQNVEAYFATGEAMGKRFTALTPSYIPAIRNREHLFARKQSDHVVVALEPHLTEQNLTNALSFYDTPSDALQIFGPLHPRIPGTKPFFAFAEHSEENLSWIADQLEIANVPVKIVQRFATSESALALATTAPLQAFERQVVLTQPLGKEASVAANIDALKRHNFSLLAADSQVAASIADQFPQIELATPASNTHVETISELSSNDDTTTLSPAFEEALLDMSYEMEKGRHSQHSQSTQLANQLRKQQQEVGQELDRLQTHHEETQTLAQKIAQDNAHTQQQTDQLSNQIHATQLRSQQLAETQSVIRTETQENVVRTQQLTSRLEQLDSQTADVSNSLNRLDEKNNGLNVSVTEIRDFSHQLRTHVDIQAQLMLKLDDALRQSENRLTDSRQQIRQISRDNNNLTLDFARLQAENQDLRQSLESTLGNNKQLVLHHNELMANFHQMQSDHIELAHRVDSIRGNAVPKVEVLETKLDQLKLEVTRSTTALSDTVDQSQDAISQLQAHTDLPNAKAITDQDIDALAAFSQQQLGLDTSAAQILNLSERYRRIAERSIGEPNTSQTDAVAIALTMLSLPSNKMAYVEIGNTFGIGMAFTWDTLRHHFAAIALASVAPYATGRRQPHNMDQAAALTVLQPNEAILRQNLSQVAIDFRKLKIISESPLTKKTLSTINKQANNFVVINQNVKHQAKTISTYANTLKAGGYLVIRQPAVLQHEVIEKLKEDLHTVRQTATCLIFRKT